MNDIISPNTRYTGVLQQQGRVSLDSDWNEQTAISANVLDDTDDDLVLADLSGGSIGDQPAANTGLSFDVAESGLTDDLDDLDDLNLDLD